MVSEYSTLVQFQSGTRNSCCSLYLKINSIIIFNLTFKIYMTMYNNCLQSFLEPATKLVTFVLETSNFTINQLQNVCGLCVRAFTKARVMFSIYDIAYIHVLVIWNFSLWPFLGSRSVLYDARRRLRASSGAQVSHCSTWWKSSQVDSSI